MNTNWLSIITALLLLGLLIFGIAKQIEEYKLQDDPMLKDLRDIINPLFNTDNYFTGHLSELNNRNVLNTIGLYRGDKSYTINKEKIFLCLKDENGKYYNKNMLVYVLLHEIAHVLCDEVGHTQKFHDIFEELLLHAIGKGMYNPSIPIIQDYCKNGDKLD